MSNTNKFMNQIEFEKTIAEFQKIEDARDQLWDRAKVLIEKGNPYIEQSSLYMRFSFSVMPNQNNLTAKEWSFFGAGLNFLEGPDPSILIEGKTLQDYKQRANGAHLPYRNDAAKSITAATTFSGISTIETTAEQSGSLLFPKNGQMFLAAWSVIDGKEKPVIARETFNQILSTFKFIPSTSLGTSEPSKSDKICIQVITKAKNIQTGEVRDFPTPCDVPDGWEKINEGVIQ